MRFECNDCDTIVESAGPLDNPERRCAGCQFIAEVAQENREAMRAAMFANGAIGRPRPREAVEAYHDDSKPWRECDHCGRSYRGPSVYCCVSCALADAK